MMRLVILSLFLSVFIAGCCCPIPVNSKNGFRQFTLGSLSDPTAPGAFTVVAPYGLKPHP